MKKFLFCLLILFVLFIAASGMGYFFPKVKCRLLSIGFPNVFPGYRYRKSPSYNRCMVDHKKKKKNSLHFETEKQRLLRLKDDYERRKKQADD